VNKKILLTSLAGLTLPVLACAQTLGSMAQAIAGQVVIVAAWIVVMMWVVTGILFLTAMGDPAKINTGKLALFASIGGTIIVLLAQGAMGFVARSFGI